MRNIDLACIIDDDPIFVFGAQRFMKVANFCKSLMIFGNGKEALEALLPRLQEGKNLPVSHCIKGTKGHDFPDEINQLIETYQSQIKVIEKPTFPSIDLGVYLSKKDYQVVELCGLVSNICVLSNAVIAKGALPNAHIVVDANATASFDEALHKQSLAIMEGLHIEVKRDV